MSEPSINITTREEWRKWLKKNSGKEPVIWLIHYKKHTGKPSLPYNDAVEEALCFGWIDSLIRRIDNDRYMQKYTPRKFKSTWSKHNVRRVKKLIKEGKMIDRGMELYQYAIDNNLLPDMDENKKPDGLFPELPGFFEEAIKKNPKAEKTFYSLASSYKLQYLGWIMDARKEETRMKRIREAIELLESGKKLGMK